MRDLARLRDRAALDPRGSERKDQIALLESVRTTDTWHGLPAPRLWSLWLRYACAAFYSHPWAWNEIGFGGPAYPRGYSRFGDPDLQRAEREPWEGAEHFDRDPVTGEQEPPPR